jgi:hypothetical protein
MLRDALEAEVIGRANKPANGNLNGDLRHDMQNRVVEWFHVLFFVLNGNANRAQFLPLTHASPQIKRTALRMAGERARVPGLAARIKSAA